MPAAFFTAFGFVTAVIALALTAVKGVQAQETGIASALFNAAQQIGVALGLAVLSTISVAVTASKLPDALTALYRGREAANTEIVRMASDALVHGYGLALAGSGVALVIAAIIAAALVNAKKEQPLNNLLLAADSAFNAHHIMALEQAEDLYGSLDLLLLRPAEHLTPSEHAIAQPVPGAPPELVGVSAGRLANWHATAHAWSADDRQALAAFIDERIRPAMTRQMANVRAAQERLRKNPTRLAGAFAAMWRHGIHPLQDEAD